MRLKIVLEEPGLREGQAIFPDNNMIENTYVNERERVFEPAGNGTVCIGSRADTRRMVVRQNL